MNKVRPDKELRERYETNYYDKTDFASNARLLQSIWRTEKGFEFEKYGNFLKLDFAKETGANFLNKDIFEIVKFEVENKHIDGKVIKEPRIWNNLLSSQPLAFNIFGELKRNLVLATSVFRSLYSGREISKITGIEFEYSPGRRNPKYTGDSSAFDVFVEYKNQKDENCFFGIEVKYAEDLNDEPATHKDSYVSISEKSEIFEMSNLQKLKEKPIQQIWRDHLLALSLFVTNNDYKVGDFIYLYPSENTKCEIGIEKYKSTFNKSQENYFKTLTIENLVNTIKTHCSDKWIFDFEDRYLNFKKIEKVVGNINE
jgi:hypothetical protein